MKEKENKKKDKRTNAINACNGLQVMRRVITQKTRRTVLARTTRGSEGQRNVCSVPGRVRFRLFI
jgi:hypothetical protein